MTVDNVKGFFKSMKLMYKGQFQSMHCSTMFLSAKIRSVQCFLESCLLLRQFLAISYLDSSKKYFTEQFAGNAQECDSLPVTSCHTVEGCIS